MLSNNYVKLLIEQCSFDFPATIPVELYVGVPVSYDYHEILPFHKRNKILFVNHEKLANSPGLLMLCQTQYESARDQTNSRLFLWVKLSPDTLSFSFGQMWSIFSHYFYKI